MVIFLKGQLGERDTQRVGRLAPYRGLTKPFEADTVTKEHRNAENKVCSTKFKVILGLAQGWGSTQVVGLTPSPVDFTLGHFSPFGREKLF